MLNAVIKHNKTTFETVSSLCGNTERQFFCSPLYVDSISKRKAKQCFDFDREPVTRYFKTKMIPQYTCCRWVLFIYQK